MYLVAANVITYLVVFYILKIAFIASIFVPSYGRLISRLCVTRSAPLFNIVYAYVF